MNTEQALKFLASLGVEYAQTFMQSSPSVNETLLMRIQSAHATLVAALAPPAQPGKDVPDDQRQD